MATIASHQMGDLTRRPADICTVFKKTKDNYIGNWVTGFGFVEVKFPIGSTRNLTKKEIAKYDGMPMSMGDQVSFLNISGKSFRKSIILKKEGVGEVFAGTMLSPLKAGNFIYAVNESTGRTYHTSTIKSVRGNKVKTQNSTYTINYL